ncbi:hypothetical protein ACIBEJ_00865 [Nonomuraea sp. NPDC050790]|uniref:hypothetical protein n=1 Tax=Nonomuraea sp. NPDC050790 TaxID=3364371 RepID=UPI0037B1D748
MTGTRGAQRRLLAELRQELVELWHDLAEAHLHSRSKPPELSRECRQLIRRIKTITSVAGAVAPGQIDMRLLLTGLYQRIHAELGVNVEVPEGLIQHARDYVAGGRLALGYSEGLLEEHRDRRIYFMRQDGLVFYRIANRGGALPGRFSCVDDARAVLEDLANE